MTTKEAIDILIAEIDTTRKFIDHYFIEDDSPVKKKFEDQIVAYHLAIEALREAK